MTWTEQHRNIGLNKLVLSTGLLIALATQLGFNAFKDNNWEASTEPAKPPSLQTLRLSTLGEEQAAATAAVLYTQSYDAQAGQTVPIKQLNIRKLHQWLEAASQLNPISQYPTFLSSRFYAAIAAPSDTREILDWIKQRHQQAPATHWPALAHAVHLARHHLKDAELARQLARALRQTPVHVAIPSWARQMEAFMLRDSNEIEEARALLGGLIDSGQVNDERALAVMIADLKAIERRLSADQQP